MTQHTEPPEQPPVVVTMDSSRTVSVRLGPDWRRRIGAAGLPAATLVSLAAADQELAFSELTSEKVDVRPPEPLPGTQAEQDETLARAFRELTEFRAALAELGSAEQLVEDPSRRVAVTVRHNVIATIRIEDGWIESTDDVAVERALSAALSSATQQVSERPAQALAGCPALRAVVRAGGGTPAGRGARG